MGKTPPEKYYEACITYNLVTEFYIKYDIKLYPFSISQIEENDKGYDFGYELSNDSFFIQYKKPSDLYDVNSKKFSWKINNEQLNIINRNDIGLKTYYALPGFVSTNKWYEGLDLTYFIESIKLKHVLKNKENQITATIYSTNTSLRTWDYYFDSKYKNLSSVVQCDVVKSVTVEDIQKFALSMDEESKNTTWFYAIRKDENGK